MAVISRRPPVLARICYVAFCAGVSAWVVTANAGDYASGRAPAWVFVPVVVMVVVLMAFAWRAVTLSFRANAAGLMIHNVFRTRRVPVGQVVGFDVGASTRFNRVRVAVRVVTVSGTYPIDVFGRRHFLFPGRLCDIADDLEDWLGDARAGLTS